MNFEIFKEQLYYKIINNDINILDFINQYDYSIFKIKFIKIYCNHMCKHTNNSNCNNFDYKINNDIEYDSDCEFSTKYNYKCYHKCEHICDIFNINNNCKYCNNIKTYTYDILYLAIRYKNDILINYLIKNIKDCDIYNILDKKTDDYYYYGSTFFYAYHHYPTIAYKMFKYDKNLVFIMKNEENNTIMHKIIKENEYYYPKNKYYYNKNDIFLNLTKEKLKIFIYNYIIEKEGFDFFINHYPNFIDSLFGFGLSNGKNLNFIEYVLNKKLNDLKFNLLLTYQENKDNETPLMKLIIPSKRYNECMAFAKKIIELCPETLNQDIIHPIYEEKKNVKTYNLAKIYKNKEFCNLIDTIVYTNQLKIKYK